MSLKAWDGFLKFLETVTAYLAAFLMAALSIIVFLGVFSRYVLQDPWQWTEEAARLSFIWVVFLGAGVGVRRGLHFRFTLLLDSVGPAVRKPLEVLSNLWVIFFSGVLILKGFSFTMLNMAQLTPTMMIPWGYIYIAIPLNGVLMVLYSLDHILKLMLGVPGPMAAHAGEEVQA